MRDPKKYRRTLVLKAGQKVSDLDVWPGDTVIEDASWRLLGAVNGDGEFVPADGPG